MYLIHGGESHGRRCSLTPMIFQNSAFSKKSEPKTRKCEDGAELNIKEKREANLTADDGDGGKRFPKRVRSLIGAVVTEESACSLNSVNERDQ